MAEEKPKSKMALRKKSPARPTTVNDVPDKLLELILLHLTSPLWIIRAAAACRRWRRILTGRLHQQHPHPIAGYYHNPQPLSGSSPVFVPSSQVIDSVDRRHFSLDFLPAGGSKSWKLVDSRRSLLLLARKKSGWMRHCFPDLVVCEPLTRFYQVVPCPKEMKHHECLGVFLNVFGNRTSDFGIACVLYQSYTGVSGKVGTVRACVFGRGRRSIWRWRVGRRSSAIASLHLSVQGKEALQFVGCAVNASFWWVRDEKPQRLICAHWSTQISLFNLPEHISNLFVDFSAFRVVDGMDDKVRIACLEGAYLKVFSRSYWNDGSSDWMLEKQVNFAMATSWFPAGRKEYFGNVAANIVTASGRCVTLASKEERCLVSVELETMSVERTRIGSKSPAAAYPYQLPDRKSVV